MTKSIIGAQLRLDLNSINLVAAKQDAESNHSTSLIAQHTCGTGLSFPGTGLTFQEVCWFFPDEDGEKAPNMLPSADEAALLKLSAGSFVFGRA